MPDSPQSRVHSWPSMPEAWRAHWPTWCVFQERSQRGQSGVDRCRARGSQKSPALSGTPRPLARAAPHASPASPRGGAGPRPVPRPTSGPRVGVQRAGPAVAMAAVAQEHVQGASCGPGPAHGPFGGPFRLGAAGGVALEFRVDHRSRDGGTTPKPGVGARGGPCLGFAVRRSAAPGVGAVGQVCRAGPRRSAGLS